MTPEEYDALVIEVSGLSEESVFVRPVLKYDETRTCACGSKYHLSTPYELCQEDIRDLCDDCILKLPKLEYGYLPAEIKEKGDD